MSEIEDILAGFEDDFFADVTDSDFDPETLAAEFEAMKIGWGDDVDPVTTEDVI